MLAKIVVTAPPGRLGIELVKNVETEGTVITTVNDDSPVVGKLFKGDELIDINGVGVHSMSVKGELT